jgi:drug/metabolite transporter (DMT)-like permease
MMKRAVLIVLVFCFSKSALAVDNMTIFLKSCAYGTAAGAILGLASLAISENPDNKMNNVARGASLGLYAGIGFGLYTIYGGKKSSSDADLTSVDPIWFSPVLRDHHIAGVQVNWANFSF